MTNEWMIDVLADLRAYAMKQMMPDLAEHLDDAIMVAASEMRIPQDGLNVMESHEQQGRDISGAVTDNEFVG